MFCLHIDVFHQSVVTIIACIGIHNAGQSLKVGLGPNKLLSVHIPKACANGAVTVRYEATRLQRLSQIVSLASGIAFLALFIAAKRRRRNTGKEE